MKKLKKRLCSFMLAFVLTFSPVLSAPMRVQAVTPAIVIGGTTVVEIALILYGLVKTGMIISGIVEGINDAENGATLSESFRTFLGTATGNDFLWSNDLLFQTADGQSISLNDSDTYELEMTNGETYSVTGSQIKGFITTGDIDWSLSSSAVPKEEEWEDFKEDYAEKSNIIYHDWGSGNNNNGEDPEKEPFSKIQSFIIGNGMIAAVGDYINRFIKGDNTDLIDEYQGLVYTGQVPQNAEGNFMYRCIINNTKWNKHFFMEKDVPIPGQHCGVALDTDSFLFLVKNGSDYVVNDIWYQIDAYGNISKAGGDGVSLKYGTYQCNYPVFSNYEDALSYFASGDDSAALNSPVYDYQNLVDSVPDTMAAYENVSIPTNTLPEIDNAIQNAIPEVEPGTDPADNTEVYKEAIKEALQEVLPQPQPEPTPEPEPSPEPVPSLADINDYKVDLTNIFPFCLPFDFIALMEVLVVEPETPRFEIPFIVQSIGINETVVIDMAFLDEVMEGLRSLELVAFIGFLIFATGKVIKW